MDGIAIRRAPATSTLWIGQGRVAGGDAPVPTLAPDPDHWDNTHPLAQIGGWAALGITRAYRLAPLPHATVLLSAQGDPLLQVRRLPQGFDVHPAFDPAESTWPEQSGIAQFAAALADLLAAPPGAAPVAACIVVLVQPAGAEIPAEGASRWQGPEVGIVGAGAAARVLADPGAAPVPAQPAELRLSGGLLPLDLALAMVPEGQRGRLVLAADMVMGADAMAGLATRRVVVDRLPALPPPQGEVILRGIDLPRQVVAGDAVTAVGLAFAQSDTTALLTLLQDGRAVAEQTIALTAGNTRVEADLPPVAGGETLIEMALSAPGDTWPQNNRAGRLLTAEPPRRVLVIAPSDAHGTAFAGPLRAAGVDVEVISPGHAPEYLPGWLAYGAIVMVDTPAIALSTRQQGLIETAVADHGLGLLILGGPNSYGPGGYYQTALERLSPLSSRIPRDAPEVAMVFVLDRPGSMLQPVGEGTRLDIAKRATLSAVDLLNPRSQIGIIVFDAEAQTILPLGEVEAARTKAALDGVDPGGGTAILPGLDAALAMLSGVDAPARHVIVMTDGLSQPGDFPAILDRLRGQGITVSAVAIGQGADRSVVETIAAPGGGSAHTSSDFEALPSILSQEAMLLSEPIEIRRSQPVWADTAAGFLAGLPDPMPPVEGFVLTTAIPEARLAMVTPDKEGRDAPLLAWWRYGNGTVLALGTDATGSWTRGWQAVPAYGQFWTRALRAFLPASHAPGLHLSAEGRGEALHLTLEALTEDGEPRAGLDLTAAVTMPDGDTLVTPLRESRAGIYRAAVPLDAPGRYAVSVQVAAAPGARLPGPQSLSAAFHHSYATQFDLAHPGGAAAWLAETTGGRLVDPDEMLAAGAGLSLRWQGQGQVWALLALALFLIELVRRQAGLPRRRPTRTATARQQGSEL
ncbi:VWA domain-containing protein [Paracoccaceae bacterium Fryx2]|nr:VWA domain-containing protein [Paracoccaceae bacterium Fryx2]